MLVSAKNKAITRKCLSKDVPGIYEWIEVMLDVCRMEKQAFFDQI